MKTQQRHKVFVYGTLKKGERLHHILEREGCAYIGRGWTERNDFVLRRTNPKPHGFPVILPHTPGLPIAGEIYEVSDSILQTLDFAESNGSMYQREKLRILPNYNGKVEEAWTYIGVPYFWLGSQDHRLPMCDIINDPIKHFAFTNEDLQ